MDFRRDMLDHIDYLGLEIERIKNDISGLEAKMDEINEYIDATIRMEKGIIKALKILGDDVYGKRD